MRYLRWLFAAFAALMMTSAYAGVVAPSIYADTAPNVYGSLNWVPWWNSAKDDVVAGTFVNMRSGAHPGTTVFEPRELIVYSTMDLGKRLHWIYWWPGKTINDLKTIYFEVNWMVDWGGVNYVYNWTIWDLEEATLVGGIPTNGWIQPARWEEYSGGVIGTFGVAWWAHDNLAYPHNTNSSLWDEVDDADVAALANLVLRYQTHATGYLRWRSGTGDYEYMQLRMTVIPEPGTLLLWLGGLAAPAACILRRRRA